MYLLHGKITAKGGHSNELAKILIEASKLVSTAPGCRCYIVSRDESEPGSVYVTEVWETKEDHSNSLKSEEVKALIIKAIPMIEGQPEKSREFNVLGGAGI